MRICIANPQYNCKYSLQIHRKGTTKNPNVQIKFILFCHLQDFATVTSGET